MYAQAREYVKAQVTMVDRKQLLLLMFDGGLDFLRRAREALATDDLPRFAENSQRAAAIICELRGTLDYEAGAKIASTLGRLYEFMLVHMTEANSRRSVRHVDEVIRVLEIIAGAYRSIIEAPARPGTAG